jgi:hypothetical protein
LGCAEVLEYPNDGNEYIGDSQKITANDRIWTPPRMQAP